ncbi:MAG: relaxase/mobilization nuclease domain-containing protein [Coriobacteriales bacterium]|jgi:hypothetical protein
MPYVKAISGHTKTGGVMRYLTKNGRALAIDYLNLDAPVIGGSEQLPEYGPFDWATAMDATRHCAGNDTPWKGRPARTYKHYILSPDPGDKISLSDLRRLAVAVAEERFGEYEVAIVYHDDNANNVPHAHIVVNNTNLETGHRIQEPDPREIKRAAQRIAREMGLSFFRDEQRPEKEPFKARKPYTHQREYRRKAEKELEGRGEYSWVSDIRNRVAIARTVTHSEEEFKAALKEMGIEVAPNSPKASRADWVYSFSDRPTWRITGEKLGLSYGREAIRRRLALKGGHVSSYSERRIVEEAKRAHELASIDDLAGLANLVRVCDRFGISDMEGLRSLASRNREEGTQGAADALEFARRHDVLPESIPKQRQKVARPDAARPKKRNGKPESRWNAEEARRRYLFNQGIQKDKSVAPERKHHP